MITHVQSINQSKHINIAQYVSCKSEFSFQVTLESSEQFSEFETEGALTLKALTDNESAILGTDSHSISADRSVRSGW